MIGNTPEYFQANNLIFRIMDMINGCSLFDDLKPLQESDIVNLALDILKIIVSIHAFGNSKESHDNQGAIQDISESSNHFVNFADIVIECQRSKNEDLRKVFIALTDAKDVDALIDKILINGALL